MYTKFLRKAVKKIESMRSGKEKYKIAKYKVTYELIEDDVTDEG